MFVIQFTYRINLQMFVIQFTYRINLQMFVIQFFPRKRRQFFPRKRDRQGAVVDWRETCG